MLIYEAYSLLKIGCVALTNPAFPGWAVALSPDPAADPVYSYQGAPVNIRALPETATEREQEAVRLLPAMLQSDGWTQENLP